MARSSDDHILRVRDGIYQAVVKKKEADREIGSVNLFVENILKSYAEGRLVGVATPLAGQSGRVIGAGDLRLSRVSDHEAHQSPAEKNEEQDSRGNQKKKRRAR